MGINLLKFQTKNGTKLIFDNSSGIVIPENDDTEYLINHIADDKNDIIEELSEYYGAAEPPVRCGESHLSGLTEPPQFVY